MRMRKSSESVSKAELKNRFRYPVLIVPGFMSSGLQVVESESVPRWKGKRLWLNVKRLGFSGKILGTKNKISTNDAEASNVKLRNDWLSHMTLEPDLRSERPGIKVRAIPSLDGCDYLEPGIFTNAASYVFGPLIRRLVAEGYEPSIDLDAATYDWRLAPKDLEERDAYFTNTMVQVENMRNANGGRKVALLAHSMGCVCAHYLLNFAANAKGREWIDENIECFIPAGAPHLGASQSMRSVILGNNMGLPSAFLKPHSALIMGRSLGSTPWLLPTSSEGSVESASDAAAAVESGALGDMVCCALVREQSVLRVSLREADVRKIASRHPEIERLRIKITVGDFEFKSKWFRPRDDAIVSFIENDVSGAADMEDTNSKLDSSLARAAASLFEDDDAHGADEIIEDDIVLDDNNTPSQQSREESEEAQPESGSKLESGPDLEAGAEFVGSGTIFEIGLCPTALSRDGPGLPFLIELEEQGLITKQKGAASCSSFCSSLNESESCCSGLWLIMKSAALSCLCIAERTLNVGFGTILNKGLTISSFFAPLGEILGQDYRQGSFVVKEASLAPVVGLQKAIKRSVDCECKIGIGFVWSDPAGIHRSAQVKYPEKETAFVRRRRRHLLAEIKSGGYKQYSPADMLKLEGNGVQRNLDLWEGESFQLDPHVSPVAPPVSKVHAIYGIDVDTEVATVYTRHNRVIDQTELQSVYQLDENARLDKTVHKQGYRIKEGRIYETSKPPQDTSGGDSSTLPSGDGTVPYRSLHHVHTWAPHTDLTIQELPGLEHRAMLNSPAFHSAVLKHVIPSFTDVNLPPSSAAKEEEEEEEEKEAAAAAAVATAQIATI